MFILNIMDEWNSITDSYSFDTLEQALIGVKEQVKEGALISYIQLMQEIELDFTVDVEVKVK